MCMGITVQNRQLGGWTVISTHQEIVVKYLDNSKLQNVGMQAGFTQIRKVGITSAGVSR